MLQPLLTLIRGESFRKVVGELEGYDASVMEEVVREAKRRRAARGTLAADHLRSVTQEQTARPH